MKIFPDSFNSKIESKIQTISNKAEPKAIINVKRNPTALVNNKYLERVLIKSASEGEFTDSSVAVSHPTPNGSNDRCYIAYIQNGKAKVCVSRCGVTMNQFSFADVDFEVDATAVSIAFDSFTAKTTDDKYEYITYGLPMIFYVTPSGALMCREVGLLGETVIASAGVTDVSAVRGMYSVVERFDFGLCVFFIQNGVLMYRQLINGVWYDAETISFGPENTTWKKVSASRTWDYRLCIQAVDTDGNLYEMYSQYEGFGIRNQEHLEIANITASLNMTEVAYIKAKTSEHIELDDISATMKLLYGGTPELVNAYNVGVEVDDDD